MPTRSLFATPFYEGMLGDDALVAELDEACRDLQREDRAGVRWSREHGYRGYTSYASLNDLPVRVPAFADLKRHLDRHVAAFARDCGFDLANGRGGERRLKLDSLWVNVLKPGGSHSGHLHPNSVVSGTVYIAVPPGSGALRLEDPRLPMMMAAPPRLPDAAEALRPFVHAKPAAGAVFLWESWLRHEVMPSTAPNRPGCERISASFNYRW